VPRQILSTYRVQLRAEFDFDAVAAVADYLSALGVSHLYCSPYLQAAAGSTHGYDVVDPTRVSEELGGEAGPLPGRRPAGAIPRGAPVVGGGRGGRATSARPADEGNASSIVPFATLAVLAV